MMVKRQNIIDGNNGNKKDVRTRLWNNKKGELPRLKCFHNGIILIVICVNLYDKDNERFEITK